MSISRSFPLIEREGFVRDRRVLEIHIFCPTYSPSYIGTHNTSRSTEVPNMIFLLYSILMGKFIIKYIIDKKNRCFTRNFEFRNVTCYIPQKNTGKGIFNKKNKFLFDRSLLDTKILINKLFRIRYKVKISLMGLRNMNRIYWSLRSACKGCFKLSCTPERSHCVAPDE